MTKISNQYSLTNILTADLANSRLGINNVSPAYSLDLTGTARTSGATYLATGGSNVGIGTTSPAGISTYTTLDIRGATGGGIKIGVTGSSTPFNLQQAGTDAYLNNVASGVMYFLNGDAERMRITSAGNVGIGTTTPSQKLEVNGTIKASGAFVQATGNIYIGDWTGFYDVSTSTSKVYLLQLVPTDSIPLLNYRLFGVIQTNTTSGTYYFTSISSQTMEVRFVSNTIQVRITNGNGYYFNWSITQLC